MLWLLACATPVETEETDFDAAVHLAFAHLLEAEEADAEVWILAIEAEVDAKIDLANPDVLARSLTPTPLTAEDLAGVTVPDRDPSLALANAVARLSTHPRSDHLDMPLMVDQTPVEPQCPDHYVRSFLEGEDCWPECALRTSNDVTKTNLLFTVDYVLPKDFRPVVLGDGRVATLARSYTTRRNVSADGTAAIEQSESVELWLDRPDGSGTLRLMSVWSETVFTDMEVDDSMVIGTVALGTDAIFVRQDEWLAAGGG